MIDMLRGYLNIASGVTEVPRRRALQVARQLLEAAPGGGVISGGVTGAGEAPDLASRANALADELIAAGRNNRALLLELVRTEVEAVLTRLGLDSRTELEAQLAASRARVRELEAELAKRSAVTKPAAKKTAAKKTATKKTATKKTATRKTAARKTAAKATSTTTRTRKAAASKSAARESTAGPS